MDFEHLREHGYELLDYLKSESYTESYVQIVRQDLNWILRNGEGRPWKTYLDAYHDRVSHTESELYKKNHRIAFGAIQQFDLFGEYPNRKVKNCLVKHGAYHQLLPEFKELVDHCRETATFRGLEKSTIGGDASSASCFFFAMQERGLKSLAGIGEGLKHPTLICPARCQETISDQPRCSVEPGGRSFIKQARKGHSEVSPLKMPALRHSQIRGHQRYPTRTSFDSAWGFSLAVV